MIIFILIYSIWFASEIMLNRLLRSGINDEKGQDKGSIRIIWITIVVANTLGVILPFFFSVPISNQLIISYLGLFIIIVGMVIRFIAIRSLGKLFTVDVTIRENHTLKKDGMYKIVRHPSYSGSLLSFIGFGLSLNNWLSLLIISLLVTTAMLNRIKIEEKLLTREFGTDYSDYMKKTYRLIPWLF